jgi:hypothetical protein
MDATFGPELSNPANIFEKNIRRLTLLIQAPIPQAEAISAKVDAAIKDKSGPSATQPIVQEMHESIMLRATIMSWAIPMLVTFTESYLEDAFALIISGAFEVTALPTSIIQEISEKWIKNIIRSGNPHQWINQLRKFGVQGYPDDLAAKLQRTWTLRHEIIHSAEPDISVMLKEFPLSESLKNVGAFVLTTDAFVIAHSTKAINRPPTSA